MAVKHSKIQFHKGGGVCYNRPWKENARHFPEKRKKDKKMKKLTALLLVFVMMLGLVACGTPAAPETPTEDNAAQEITPIEIDASIAFAGSSSLAPVIASIGEAFRTEYGTWDKVNPAFPAEEIDIPVASGGSGDGPKSVVEGTADFGMLARAVKDSEKESLGAGYTEFMVASDALTISVNKNNPIASKMDDIDTDTLRAIFSGEIAYWDELDASLEHKEIVVCIRDLTGGAAEVFEKQVMQGTPITETAIQTPSMGALAAKIAENEYTIGYAGYGVYNLNTDSLFAFKFNGVEPTEENILNGSYTIQRPVLFVANRELDAGEQAFVDYIFSETGRNIVIENGYIPAF